MGVVYSALLHDYSFWVTFCVVEELGLLTRSQAHCEPFVEGFSK
jgi:hypothetical protein